MVSFLDVTGIKSCPDLSPNKNALRIASGTEPTLIRKEDTTPLTVAQFLCSLLHCKRWRRWSTFNGRQRLGRWANRPPLCRRLATDDISVNPCSCRPRVATTNLCNSCTCGLERFPSARNDTFVDCELCSYTGDGTLLLQLSDQSSTSEVVQVHEQMSRFGGLSEERPSVFKTPFKLGTHLSTQCSGDERQSRPCPAC
ncbi:hypothetical protein TNCV_1746621 [Trichonephila clavipes]|nr:hypothetical protein TNCV_1746621 [Trichonephila clavipes]